MTQLRGLLLLLILSLPSAYGANELLSVVQRGDEDGLKKLLTEHADVNAATADGWTALHEAVLRSYPGMVGRLLSAGARVSAVTQHGITPLSLACTNGTVGVVQQVLTFGAEVNATSEAGQTALMSAALTGRPEVVRLLLGHGAKPNLIEPVKGQTALMWAASEGNSEAAALLIEFGAQVNAKSFTGFTPLLFAVRNGHIETVKLLLAHGGNANDTAPDGTSALNMAVVNAYFELASLLLDHGADPNATDPRGSALHTLAWLRKPGSDGGAGVGRRSYAPPIPTGNMTALELARVLLHHGANPNIRISWKEKRFDKEGGSVRTPPLIQLGRRFLSFNGATPFYVAAQNGDAAMMRVLAEGGADPSLPTRSSITPLMTAAGLGYWEGESPGPFTGCSEEERLEAVKVALALGGNINAHADFGHYPMQGDPAYTLLYYPHNIDQLLDLGVGDPRWSGSTALHGAILSGQASIVQYLIDHGADVNASTKLGWTPLMLAQGVFFANAKKEYPAASVIIEKALHRGSTQPGTPQGRIEDADGVRIVHFY